MASFSGAERALCVREYYRDNDSVAVGRLITIYAMQNMLQVFKLYRNGYINSRRRDQREPHSSRPRASRKPVNVERVSESIQEQPRLSTRKRASVLNLPRTSLNRILHKDLHLYPYKIQIVQALKPSDHVQRLKFVDEMLQKISSFNNILFLDETHFLLNGFVNRQIVGTGVTPTQN
ncbi:unnamed protein product [Diatraea saccharalis]|uniref:Transposase n=1 Tax=Diatraea saccharalis TaxID=40085 RepID=A0A9N9N278_9NEOP|nr:unnamed protein product [Diatraea saccharalis]